MIEVNVNLTFGVAFWGILNGIIGNVRFFLLFYENNKVKGISYE